MKPETCTDAFTKTHTSAARAVAAMAWRHHRPHRTYTTFNCFFVYLQKINLCNMYTTVLEHHTIFSWGMPPILL